MPPCAARNALDCALLDLEAKQSGQRIWDLLAAPPPTPVHHRLYDLARRRPKRWPRRLPRRRSAAAEDQARRRRRRRTHRRGAQGGAALRADRRCQRGLDAREPRGKPRRLRRAGVTLVEQPLPAGQDEALARIRAAGRRSAPTKASTTAPRSSGSASRYDAVNIKLDKTGGLTEALAMADAASALGFDIMVGCMVATSLSMAPAMLLAPQAPLRRSRRPAAARPRSRRRPAL